MPEPAGYLCLLLHAHLPFVRHLDDENALEERWLQEAVSETYLPLLEVMEGWERDGVDWRLTISLSPTLAAMLRDPLLQQRCRSYLAGRLSLAEHETVRTKWLPEQYPVACHYRERFQRQLHAFEDRYARDLAAAFGALARTGRLELITCPATHGFLPLLQHQPAAVQAQVRVGLEQHGELFGQRPAGFWSAECGYYPGLDEIFAQEGIEYFFIDAHGLIHASPAPRRGIYAPALCHSGVRAFARDGESAREVWSAEVGFPGDPVYREFYRDAAYDLEAEYLTPYIHPSGLRVDTGLKYHRITRRGAALAEKEPYDWDGAQARAAEHALQFAARRLEQVKAVAGGLDRPPLVVAPYDAELFGHWWFEGPVFLDCVMRVLNRPELGLCPVTPGQYLKLHSDSESVEPSYSSWGVGGYAAMWLDPANEWIWPPLHGAVDRMTALARRHRQSAGEDLRRALNQMGRELLLAQASDWPFILKMGTAAGYAERRIREHLERFDRLASQVEQTGSADMGQVRRIEERDNLFPDLRFDIFC